MRHLRWNLFLLLAFLSMPSAGFSAWRSSFRVERVQSDDDWNALADIRFEEWIQQDGSKSRQAFRAATKDIYQEERPESLLFLAKYQELCDLERQPGSKDYVATVGAAEMSHYELMPALAVDAPFSAFYVTDVVTSSNFRRQGIARRMMQRLEEEATCMGITHLVLNVANGNDAAVQFYGSLGYDVPTLDVLKYLDVSKLEEAAGTTGQILLTKQLLDSGTDE